MQDNVMEIKTQILRLTNVCLEPQISEYYIIVSLIIDGYKLLFLKEEACWDLL